MLLVKGQEGRWRGGAGEAQEAAPGRHVHKMLESGAEGVTARLGAAGTAS